VIPGEKIMKKIVVLLAGLMLCLSPTARADVPDPDVLIKNTVREVLDIVRADKDLRAGNQKKLLELVDAKVLPHFNFERMTKLAVGKSWRTATPEQKQEMMTEFRIMLVRTYTKAFTSYRDQTVEIKAFKLDAAATEVTVKTAIVKPGSQQPILVDYDMEKTPNGWKVFDMTVEGVDLVASKRSEFADVIQQSGVDGLIKKLTDMNHMAAANAASAEKAASK
jgi:phospholipid transport system substrate-binding protein